MSEDLILLTSSIWQAAKETASELSHYIMAINFINLKFGQKNLSTNSWTAKSFNIVAM